MASARGLSARSFGGCDNCRGRRVKCDETRPSCLLCKAAGLICKGYGKNIFFVSADDADDSGPLADDPVRFRRLLFTEIERRDMSQQLTLSVPQALVSKKLLRIDQVCDNTPQSESLQLQIGPFGVFRDAVQASERRDSTAELEIDWSFGLEIPDIDEPSCVATQEACSLSPIHHASQSFMANMTNQDIQDVSSLPPSQVYDIADIPDLNATVGNLHEIASMSTDVRDFCLSVNDQAIFNNTTLLHHQMPFNIGIDVRHPFDVSAFPISPSPGISMPVPGDAVFLLKHYTTNVVNLITPFGHKRTPWHILFIPHVKSCLAALTMGENLSHASLTIFFGTLAISASSLGRRSPGIGSIWSRRAKLYGKYAREHCQATLATAYDVPKAAKYKTILMALLTMTQLYNLTANHQHIDFYLVEAEKFIRLKGLNRHKSRKVRLLHHCYAFQRVFYESICVNSNIAHRHEVRKVIESSGSSIYSIDSLSFNMNQPQWRNLPRDMLVLKSLEIGENDLHLERPGIWPPTLYAEIYGVPETIVFFLSCIIRLSKAKEASSRPQPLGTSGLSISTYLDLAKILETCIKEYRPSHNTTSTEKDASKPNGDLKPDGSALITGALQNALEIYFYRKIYDVDTSILQHLVSNVLASLTLHQCLELDFASNGSLCLVWPAFIAAREAEDATVRKAFSEWFENCARSSGLKTFNVTLKTVEDAWTRRATCATAS
ncbi:arginine metabolism regulation protein II [Xylaria sp. FL1777]|nr:arginine metabolism regulation protein II [Xylaria sp. FL1777]